MNGFMFSRVISKYKKCPSCGSSYKGTDLQISLKDEIITVSCACGFMKKVDGANKEVK